MTKANPKVDAFLRRATRWRAESEKLRNLLLRCPVAEELKWGKPCYSFQGSNIFIIQGFKEYCALMFCKGALLKDAKGLMKRPGEHTQAARQLRFTGVREIVELEPTVKAYIDEAIAAAKAGLEVEYKKPGDFTVPEEVQSQFDKNPAWKTAFYALTPGRQKGYILYFSQAKQSKTREARVEKCMPQILKGKGWNEDYAPGEEKE